MRASNSQPMTPEMLEPDTLGRGVHNPMDYRVYAADAARATRMYKDVDISLVVWNLEPGQEGAVHSHPESAHAFLVLCGSGEYLRGPDVVPIKAGDCVIIPRLTVHSIRNTGSDRLSYLAFTNQGMNGYSRLPG
jgi:mannose-6-phosphate isomerase-like protein (cupin superfamily)